MEWIGKVLDATPCSALDALLRLARHPAVVAATSVVSLLALYQLENHWLSLPFAICVVGCLCGTLFLISGRIAFSIYTGWMIAGLVGAISLVKYKLKGFSLHYHDVFFSIGDPEAVRFLFESYPNYIIPVLVLAAAMAIFAALLFRGERRMRFPAKQALPILMIPLLLLPVTFPAEASVQRYFYYLQGRHVTAFFVSLLDLEFLMRDDALETRLVALPPQPSLPDMRSNCSGEKPDILLVLSESQFNPADFANLENAPGLSKQLEQANGPLKPLMVESYGGGTWITTLSLLTGLSASDFGWRSPYLTVELEGKVHETLPQVLARCGYRTAVQMPMNRGFVNEGPFFDSIGFETIRDRDDIGAPHYHMRDDFYFSKAEEFIQKHRRKDGRPLFLLVQTMFAHSPYAERLVPEVSVPGEPLAGDPEIAEYLRRLVIARDDLTEFIGKRRQDAGPNGTVIMDFGDHQPAATMPLLENETQSASLTDPRSLAYRTFYTMSRYDPDGSESRFSDEEKSREPSPVDIPFLGTRLLSFAGVAPGPLWTELARLDRKCEGRFHTCPLRTEIDKNLRRRADSGLLDILPDN